MPSGRCPRRERGRLFLRWTSQDIGLSTCWLGGECGRRGGSPSCRHADRRLVETLGLLRSSKMVGCPTGCRPDSPCTQSGSSRARSCSLAAAENGAGVHRGSLAVAGRGATSSASTSTSRPDASAPRCRVEHGDREFGNARLDQGRRGCRCGGPELAIATYFVAVINDRCTGLDAVATRMEMDP